jgi:hypothetical protein
VPYGTRAPKELLHHLPALILRRPSVSADPTGMLSGLLGSRLLDRRPPHYRCPAVPGFNASARAILMALGSSVLPSGINHLLRGDCVLLVMRTTPWPRTAPLFGSQPRRPSCVCSGLEPHCRTSRCARPQPTPSPRYCSPPRRSPIAASRRAASSSWWRSTATQPRTRVIRHGWPTPMSSRLPDCP